MSTTILAAPNKFISLQHNGDIPRISMTNRNATWHVRSRVVNNRYEYQFRSASFTGWALNGGGLYLGVSPPNDADVNQWWWAYPAAVAGSFYLACVGSGNKIQVAPDGIRMHLHMTYCTPLAMRGGVQDSFALDMVGHCNLVSSTGRCVRFEPNPSRIVGTTSNALIPRQWKVYKRFVNEQMHYRFVSAQLPNMALSGHGDIHNDNQLLYWENDDGNFNEWWVPYRAPSGRYYLQCAISGQRFIGETSSVLYMESTMSDATEFVVDGVFLETHQAASSTLGYINASRGPRAIGTLPQNTPVPSSLWSVDPTVSALSTSSFHIVVPSSSGLSIIDFVIQVVVAVLLRGFRLRIQTPSGRIKHRRIKHNAEPNMFSSEYFSRLGIAVMGVVVAEAINNNISGHDLLTIMQGKGTHPQKHVVRDILDGVQFWSPVNATIKDHCVTLVRKLGVMIDTAISKNIKGIDTALPVNRLKIMHTDIVNNRLQHQFDATGVISYALGRVALFLLDAPLGRNNEAPQIVGLINSINKIDSYATPDNVIVLVGDMSASNPWNPTMMYQVYEDVPSTSNLPTGDELIRAPFSHERSATNVRLLEQQRSPTPTENWTEKRYRATFNPFHFDANRQLRFLIPFENPNVSLSPTRTQGNTVSMDDAFESVLVTYLGSSFESHVANAQVGVTGSDNNVLAVSLTFRQAVSISDAHIDFRVFHSEW